MPLCRFPLLPFLSLLATLLLAPHAAAQAGGFDAARSLVRSADANGDGELDAQEWEAFVASLRPEADGTIDRHRVKARLLWLDADGDGKLTARDV